MKTATLADIVISAQAAANEAFAAPNSFSRQQLKLAKFSESGFDQADFDNWESSFNSQLDMLATFSKQPSVATAAAKKAESVKARKRKTLRYPAAVSAFPLSRFPLLPLCL